MNNEMVIGLDYGNFYSQPIYIMGMDPKTKCGGTVVDLTDPSSPEKNGIPTAFFRHRSLNDGNPLCGNQAVTSRPARCIVRYLKRRMDETVELDGMTFAVNDMITATIQHCVRVANRQLKAQFQQTTNKIALSYPITFDHEKRQRLIALAQAATLEDGTHLKVVGTIAEPAAAALDYLATDPNNREETCVMAYDLGAGTFDLAVVKAFPGGRLHPDNGMYYYDAVVTGGISDLGGKEFDQVLCDLAVKKMNFQPTGNQMHTLLQSAETAKRDFVHYNKVHISIETDDDVFSAEITRDEFNEKAEPLVMQTVEEIKKMLAKPNVPQPEMMVLAGGASQLPLVQQVLEREFPEYVGRIKTHVPSQAIARGAARFNANEHDQRIQRGGVILQRTNLELGTLFCRADSSASEFIELMIPAGTPIPYHSPEITGCTMNGDQTQLDMSLWEAVKTNPDRNNPAEDYKQVLPLTLDLGRSPKQAGVDKLRGVTQVHIDENNLIRLETWEPDRKEQTLVTVGGLLVDGKVRQQN